MAAICFLAGFGTAPAMAGDALRPSDLNRHPQKYDRKLVTIEGILLVQDPKNGHLQAIYDSRFRLFWMGLREKIGLGESEKRPDKGCVTLMNTGLLWGDREEDDQYEAENLRFRKAKIKGGFIAKVDPEAFFLANCPFGSALWIEEVVEIK
jgi:hypothetical protein